MFSYPSVAFLSPSLSLTRYEALFSVFISLSLFLYLYFFISLSFSLYYFIYITLPLAICVSLFSLLWFNVAFNGVFWTWFFLTGWWTLGPHSDEKFWSSCVARKLVNHGKCSGSLYRYFLFIRDIFFILFIFTVLTSVTVFLFLPIFLLRLALFCFILLLFSPYFYSFSPLNSYLLVSLY